MKQADSSWVIHHVRLSPEKQIGIHRRNEWELSYVIRGRGERHLDGVVQSFAEGDLVLVIPNVNHGWIFYPESADAHGCIECISLQWSPEFMRRMEQLFPEFGPLARRFQSLSECAVFEEQKCKALVEGLFATAACHDSNLPVHLVGLLNNIALSLPEAQYISKQAPPSLAEKRLRLVEIYTSCNYARKITLAEVARYVGMNRSAFCSFFSREMGESYMSYLNRHRLKVARQLLEQNFADSISSVCWKCGFNDLGYFDRLFRREYNESPSAVKQAASCRSSLPE